MQFHILAEDRAYSSRLLLISSSNFSLLLNIRHHPANKPGGITGSADEYSRAAVRGRTRVNEHALGPTFSRKRIQN